jgi:hypothetical protein
LKISIEIKDFSGFIIPLSIQTLLENCFKHNIISEEKPLTVKLWRDNDFIVVQNNLQKRRVIQDSNGIGLETICKRYDYLSQHPMEIVQDENYFTVDGINYFPILHQLVSSELDCDRMDYLLRDSYFCGVSYGSYDLDWLLNNVDYEDIETIKNFPKNFPFNNAAICWEGQLQPKESGLFRFNLYYAGYTKVFVDDSLVVKERWRTAWNPNSYKFSVQLDKNKRHKLRIEWQPDGGVSYVGLKALSPVPDNEQIALAEGNHSHVYP